MPNLPYNERPINLIINRLTKAKYEELLENNQINDNELYYIIDDDGEQLVKGYAQEILDQTLLDYVKQQDIANLKEIEANPVVEGSTEPDMLINLKIGNQVFKVNEVDTSQTMSFSTSSAPEPAPLLRSTKGLLRSASVQNVYDLKTITIGDDVWNIEPDLSEYSTSNEVTEEIQATQEELQYKIDDLKELLGQSLNAYFDIEGYYYDTGLGEDRIIACYYRDPDYGNEADILYYYIYTEAAQEEAAIMFTYI
jgi:hypothetical protein